MKLLTFWSLNISISRPTLPSRFSLMLQLQILIVFKSLRMMCSLSQRTQSVALQMRAYCAVILPSETLQKLSRILLTCPLFYLQVIFHIGFSSEEESHCGALKYAISFLGLLQSCSLKKFSVSMYLWYISSGVSVKLDVGQISLYLGFSSQVNTWQELRISNLKTGSYDPVPRDLLYYHNAHFRDRSTVTNLSILQKPMKTTGQLWCSKNYRYQCNSSLALGFSIQTGRQFRVSRGKAGSSPDLAWSMTGIQCVRLSCRPVTRLRLKLNLRTWPFSKPSIQLQGLPRMVLTGQSSEQVSSPQGLLILAPNWLPNSYLPQGVSSRIWCWVCSSQLRPAFTTLAICQSFEPRAQQTLPVETDLIACLLTAMSSLSQQKVVSSVLYQILLLTRVLTFSINFSSVSRRVMSLTKLVVFSSVSQIPQSFCNFFIYLSSFARPSWFSSSPANTSANLQLSNSRIRSSTSPSLNMLLKHSSVFWCAQSCSLYTSSAASFRISSRMSSSIYLTSSCESCSTSLWLDRSVYCYSRLRTLRVWSQAVSGTWRFSQSSQSQSNKSQSSRLTTSTSLYGIDFTSSLSPFLQRQQLSIYSLPYQISRFLSPILASAVCWRMGKWSMTSSLRMGCMQSSKLISRFCSSLSSCSLVRPMTSSSAGSSAAANSFSKICRMTIYSLRSKIAMRFWLSYLTSYFGCSFAGPQSSRYPSKIYLKLPSCEGTPTT